jgi:exodeoxyribonuclease-3
MKLRIITWNVNSVRRRLDLIARLIAEQRPDILCLQETKVRDSEFPTARLAELGYPHALIHGMKGYNGVAIFSARPLRRREVQRWCGRDDRRHAFVEIAGGIEIHNLYVPSGGDVPDPEKNEKFAHKLRFLEELADGFGKRRRNGARLILLGDLNVAPLPNDVWSHRQMRNVISHTPVEVERLSRLMASADWIDAVRHFVPESERLYSWWSYRARNWETSDRGRRLDHIWVTAPLASSLKGATVLREARGWPTPSDHVPVILDLAI